MKTFQDKVADFNIQRGWSKDTTHLKDFLLNIHEEVGEVWNIIKWVDQPTQRKLIEEHKAEFKDFIGDELFLILKIAWLLDIDAGDALQATLDEYETRFPVKDILAKKHGNPLAGGIDNKQNKGE